MRQENTAFADCILPLPLPGNFTYQVPEAFQTQLQPGMRVIVQFGKKKFYSALVKNIHQSAPTEYETKPIVSILDDEPVIHPMQFKFWEWIAEYYHCTEGEVLKAALPSGLKLESETRILYNPDFEEKPDERFSVREDLVAGLISKLKVCSVQELNQADPRGNAFTVIKSLLQKGAIHVEEKMKSSYKPLMAAYVQLTQAYSDKEQLNQLLDKLNKVPKQQTTLMAFLQHTRYFSPEGKTELLKKELLEKAKQSAAVLNGLVKKGVFEIVSKPVNRLENYRGVLKENYTLSPAQQEAFNGIQSAFAEKKVTLLHGVTSSGKTEIYIELINQYLQRGEQVLYLLPEIGLTTQIINRLKVVFGDKVGLYHSKFNDGERVEIWNKVLTGNSEQAGQDYQLIVGARSAVFLPFKKLGLIIVDEEHENSYKQFDPAPRYHARDAAVVLAHHHHANVLLGTATPAIETYFNALNGKYGLVSLTERYKNMALPQILTADIRDAYKRKQMKGHFTPILAEEMKLALENKEQIILFQNRRGYAPFMECKTCGWVPKCKHCDVSLTFHKHNGTLVCHYCGFTVAKPIRCSACGSDTITTKGFGTEKIEDNVAEIFPEARIARMDLDTTRAKKAYEKIIADFEQGNIDILIGTQMITKGLDFERVSIVGILNADNMLNYPDFRSFERSFQLMTQVSGRAGRKHKQGKVIIQTSDPEHPVINHVKSNDYLTLYKEQIAERKFFKYPPFHRLIGITLKHRDKQALDRITDALAKTMRRSFGTRVMGPEYPSISRIQTWYIKKMWLKIERTISIVSAKSHMQELVDNIKDQPGNKSVQIIIDVDPM